MLARGRRGDRPACPGGSPAGCRPAPCRAPRPAPRRSWRTAPSGAAGRSVPPGRRSGPWPAPWTIDWTVTIAVRTVPTSTRNMTGFCASCSGVEHDERPQVAMLTSAGSNSLSRRVWRRWSLQRLGVGRRSARAAAIAVIKAHRSIVPVECSWILTIGSVHRHARVAAHGSRPNGIGRQVVGDRAEHDGRHERQRADQEHRPQQHRRRTSGCRSAACRIVCGHALLLPTRKPAIASGRISGRKPAEQQDDARGDVPRRVVVGQALEPRAVVGRRRGELVEDLAEAVRAGVGHGLACPSRSPRTGPSPQQIRSGWIRTASIASLTSLASTFLPRYSGVRPTISPARNTATMMYISMFMKPRRCR